jgi:4-diphosphocytidyl-2C-methyl-D-erythritol kinase
MSGSGSAVFGLFRQVPQNFKQIFPDSYSVFILV